MSASVNIVWFQCFQRSHLPTDDDVMSQWRLTGRFKVTNANGVYCLLNNYYSRNHGTGGGYHDRYVDQQQYGTADDTEERGT